MNINFNLTNADELRKDQLTYQLFNENKNIEAPDTRNEWHTYRTSCIEGCIEDIFFPCLTFATHEYTPGLITSPGEYPGRSITCEDENELYRLIDEFLESEWTFLNSGIRLYHENDQLKGEGVK